MCKVLKKFTEGKDNLVPRAFARFRGPGYEVEEKGEI
jgi:hypothetical protein